jgi:hypothetical protein
VALYLDDQINLAPHPPARFGRFVRHRQVARPGRNHRDLAARPRGSSPGVDPHRAGDGIGDGLRKSLDDGTGLLD